MPGNDTCELTGLTFSGRPTSSGWRNAFLDLPHYGRIRVGNKVEIKSMVVAVGRGRDRWGVHRQRLRRCDWCDKREEFVANAISFTGAGRSHAASATCSVTSQRLFSEHRGGLKQFADDHHIE